MKSLRSEIKPAWNLNEPANKDFSHVRIDIGLPLHIILSDDGV